VPHGYKREYNDVLYFKKDHFCPDCGTKLEKVPVSKVVNSRSPEAKDFDFSMGSGTYAVGDIQFTWDEFECPNCKKHLTVKEMKKFEKDVNYMKVVRTILWIIICIIFAVGLLYLFTGSLEGFPTPEQQEKSQITAIIMMIIPAISGIILFLTRKKK
jgi:ssDNA-binding Zn-finger/Zn-ribbon topoisomerase 1